MSSRGSQNFSDASCIQYEDQFEIHKNQVGARKYEIERLSQQIKINPDNMILYKQKAFLLQTQAVYLQGLDKFKLLLDLSYCQNQIIEQSTQIDEYDLNGYSFENQCQEDKYGLYSEFDQQTLAKYTYDRINTQNQINEYVQDANKTINTINQELHLKPTIYQLYIEKAQQQLILAYQSVGQGQFLQELQNPFERLQTAINIIPNQKSFLLKKKQELCEQILESLDIDSFEYLEILYQIMLVLDEQTEVEKKSSQSIQEQKVFILLSNLRKYHFNLIQERIQILKTICENCICSIRKLRSKNKRIQIQNLSLEAKVYTIFAKLFIENSVFFEDNNIEFQLAQELFQKIIYSLNTSQSKFKNQLAHLKFKIKIYQDLITWIDRDLDKIKFQELICETQEQICNETSQVQHFLDSIYELEQLKRMQNKDDVEILIRILIVYDKMMENSEKDQEFFQNIRQEEFYQDCYSSQAQICESMAKLEKLLKQKEKYFCMALEYYDKAYQQDINKSELIITRIKTTVQVPVELGIEKKWNKYYDEVLQILKELSDLKIFDEFISDGFETILQRFSQQEQYEIGLKFFQFLNSIFDANQQQNLDFFLTKAHILEKMGDRIKIQQNQFYYSESLKAYDQAISIQNKNPDAVNDKFNLLIKLNRKFEALKLAQEKLFETNLMEYKYQQLLIDMSNFRETLMLGRLFDILNVRLFQQI